MKRTLTLILAMLFAAVLPGMAQTSRSEQEELKALISTINGNLPIKLAANMECYAVNLDDSMLTYYYNIAGEGNMTKLPEAQMRNYGLAMLSATKDDKDMMHLYRLLIKNGLSMRLFYTNKDTGEKAEVRFSPDDIRRMLNSEYAPEQLLDILVEQENLKLPLKLSDGMTASSIAKKDGYVVFYYDVDETLVDLDELIANKDMVRRNIVRLFETDMAAQNQNRIAMKAGYGLQYVYRGNITKQELPITFTLQDIRELFGGSEEDYAAMDSVALEDDTIAVADVAEEDSVQSLVAYMDLGFVTIALPFDSEHNEEMSEKSNFACFRSEMFNYITMLLFTDYDEGTTPENIIKEQLAEEGIAPEQIRIRYVEQAGGHDPIPYAAFLDEDGYYTCICVCNSPDKSKTLIYITMEPDGEEDAAGPDFIEKIEYN